jgi:general secretion pathway protein F
MEFRIKALDGALGVTSHVLNAVDESDARRQLELRDLRVISLTPIRRMRLFARPAQLQLAIFSQQLVSLLDAGLSLVESLEALAERESNSGANRILQRVLSRLYEGQTLAAALAEQPSAFPPLYVASVRASERTGALRESLARYITYAEQANALRKTLVNACIYPAVLLGVGLLVMLFLLGYVVPRFSAIYADVGSDLPAASRVLLQWGQLIDAHGGLMVLGLVGLRGKQTGHTRIHWRLDREDPGRRAPTPCVPVGPLVSHRRNAPAWRHSGGNCFADVVRPAPDRFTASVRRRNTGGARRPVAGSGDGE